LKQRKKTSYRRDLILAGILLVAAIAAFLMLKQRQAAQTVEGPVAVVTVNGQETGRYPLSSDGIFPLNGGSNILVVSDGEAWVSEANCPDKICMGMGKISHSGEFIACMPNGVLIIVENSDETAPDART
jgi:hypothetical protein